jgi:hypothetical protein
MKRYAMHGETALAQIKSAIHAKNQRVSGLASEPTDSLVLKSMIMQKTLAFLHYHAFT